MNSRTRRNKELRLYYQASRTADVFLFLVEWQGPNHLFVDTYFTLDGSDTSYEGHREGFGKASYINTDSLRWSESKTLNNSNLTKSEPTTHNPQPKTHKPQPSTHTTAPTTYSPQSSTLNPHHSTHSTAATTQDPEPRTQKTMQNFTTLYQDLVSNLRAILSTLVPTTPFNYSNDLRNLESNVQKTSKELRLIYDEKLKRMNIIGEEDEKEAAPKDARGEASNTFMYYFKQLEGLVCELDSYKLDGPRDFKGDRKRWEGLFAKLEGATAASLWHRDGEEDVRAYVNDKGGLNLVCVCST